MDEFVTYTSFVGVRRQALRIPTCQMDFIIVLGPLYFTDTHSCSSCCKKMSKSLFRSCDVEVSAKDFEGPKWHRTYVWSLSVVLFLCHCVSANSSKMKKVTTHNKMFSGQEKASNSSFMFLRFLCALGSHWCFERTSVSLVYDPVQWADFHDFPCASGAPWDDLLFCFVYFLIFLYFLRCFVGCPCSPLQQTLFLLMGDEDFSIRLDALTLLGRLSQLNPAYLLPPLRLTLMQILVELKFDKDSQCQEDATRMLCRFLRAPALQSLVHPFVRAIIHALPLKVCLSCYGLGVDAGGGRMGIKLLSCSRLRTVWGAGERGRGERRVTFRFQYQLQAVADILQTVSTNCIYQQDDPVVSHLKFEG